MRKLSRSHISTTTRCCPILPNSCAATTALRGGSTRNHNASRMGQPTACVLALLRRACIAREASVASLKMRSEPRSGLRSRCRCWSRTSVSSRGLRPRFRPSCNSHVPHLRAHGPVSGVTIACGAPPKVECPGNNYGCIDCTQFWSDPSHGIGVALEAVQSTPAQPSRVLAWKQVTVTPKPSAEGTTFGKTCRGVSLTALQACTFLYNTWVVIVPFLI